MTDVDSELTPALKALILDENYKPIIISPSYINGKFHLELTLKELNFISSALDAKYKTMVAGRRLTQTKRALKEKEGGIVKTPRHNPFYAIIIENIK